MVFPAIVYMAFNYDEPEFWAGWAIPAATDIAFALGILSLLGSRVPNSLKALVSVAIFDDIGAILIIALFYTNELSLSSLAFAALCLPVLYLLNRLNIRDYYHPLYPRWGDYVDRGFKSGIHATLAGVVLALFIPMFDRTDPEHSPLEELEHDLQNTVSFGILPIFALPTLVSRSKEQGLLSYSILCHLALPQVYLSVSKLA